VLPKTKDWSIDGRGENCAAYRTDSIPVSQGQDSTDDQHRRQHGSETDQNVRSVLERVDKALYEAKEMVEIMYDDSAGIIF